MGVTVGRLQKDRWEFVCPPQFFLVYLILRAPAGPDFALEAPGVAMRVRPARPWQPPGNAGRSRHKIPSAPVPFYSPVVLCLVPEAKVTTHLVKRASSTFHQLTSSLPLCLILCKCDQQHWPHWGVF